MKMGSTSPVVDLFRTFVKATELLDILSSFDTLCASLGIDRSRPHEVYPRLRESIVCNEARTLWRCINTRAAQAPYSNGQACAGSKVLIIGAGPCGLRMAIEAALLGSHAVVLEMRDYILRNNVLHLWPMVIHDLKAIGAKVFYPKFCSGNREHISIQRLQCVLVKLALMVGVEIMAPVAFQNIVEPGQGRGWRITVSPSGHPVENHDFDVIVGADGKRNSLKSFSRKCFRGKLAIGITANFVNEQKQHDSDIEEIGGLFKVFNPPFFEKLKSRGGIELENFVYFKNDTHYIVMTAVKRSLINKGVLYSDKPNLNDLLKPENINKVALANYARQAANISTDDGLACREFAKTRTGEDDVAIFDFTALHKADHSCMAVESQGKKLLMSIVGDTLIEPFWPMGTGVARGFLSVFDTAWMMKQWFSGEKTELQILGEREGIYMYLSQTEPQRLHRNLTKYTIDPKTRYDPNQRMPPLAECKVRSLYKTGSIPEVAEVEVDRRKADKNAENADNKAHGVSVTKELLQWYQSQLEPFRDVVHVTDLTRCWLDGKAFSAILSRYRPELLDVRRLNLDDPVSNMRKALALMENVYGLSPFCSSRELTENRVPDQLALLAYLTQLKVAIIKDQQSVDKASAGSKKTTIKRRLSERGMLMMMANKNKKPKKVAALAAEKRGMFGGGPASTLDRCQMRQIAKQGIKAFEQAANEQSVKVEKTSSPRNRKFSTDSQPCAICGKRLYIAERQSAHGYFFHKHCFNCAICQQPLWISNAVIHQSEENRVTFACQNHDQTDDLDSLVRNNMLDEDDDDSPPRSPIDPWANPSDTTDELSQWMGAMMISSQKGSMTSPASAGMDLGFVAVGEEVVGSDEEGGGNPDQTAMMETIVNGNDTLRRKKTFYSLARSLQLMLGHAFQEELSEAEQQEMEIEEEGKRVEQVIKQQDDDDNEGKEQLTQEFLQLMADKQELQRKQHKLMLKAKLLELQKRQSRLNKQMEDIQHMLAHKPKTQPRSSSKEAPVMPVTIEPNLDETENRIEKIADEMDKVERLAGEIHTYFSETAV